MSRKIIYKIIILVILIAVTTFMTIYFTKAGLLTCKLASIYEEPQSNIYAVSKVITNMESDLIKSGLTKEQANRITYDVINGTHKKQALGEEYDEHITQEKNYESSKDELEKKVNITSFKETMLFILHEGYGYFDTLNE